MKIVSVNVHYQEGLGYQDYYIGKEWAKMGHDVCYVSSDVHFDFPDYDNTVKHIIGDRFVGVGTFYTDFGVPVYRLKGTDRKRTGFIWLKGYKKKLIELKPDILVLHGVFNYQAIRLLYFADKLNCRIIIDDHTAKFFARKDKKSRMVFWLFRMLFAKKMLRVADKIIAITPTIIDVLRDNFGLAGEKVHMVPLGSDTDLFKSSKDLRANGRKFFNLNDDEILVLYTGKIYPEKKVHLIIDALNDPDVRCDKKIVIGLVGDASADYKGLMAEKTAGSVCKVISQSTVGQDVLPMIYNAADICAWPDSLTTSTIDASACGCPIICSKNMPERTSYNNGILIDGGDEKQLKAALKKLISNDELRKEMGQKGIQYVDEQLSWKIIAKKFLE